MRRLILVLVGLEPTRKGAEGMGIPWRSAVSSLSSFCFAWFGSSAARNQATLPSSPW